MSQVVIDLESHLFDLLESGSKKRRATLEEYAHSMLVGALIVDMDNTNRPDPEDLECVEKLDPANVLADFLKDCTLEKRAEPALSEIPKEPAEGEIRVFAPEVFDRLQDGARIKIDDGIGSEKLTSLLKTLCAKGPFRPLTSLPAPEMFDDLARKFPNFVRIVDKIKNMARISAITGKNTQKIRPMLLAGPPGVGKTAFLKALSEVLHVPISFVDCSVMTGGAGLSGLSFTWKNGSVGSVMRQVCLGLAANPVFVLDEIDKTGKMREYSNIHDVLHGILEPLTSVALVDEALGPEYPFDASFVTWFATCNRMEEIPSSLLSRFLVFDIEGPSQKEMIESVVPSIMNGILAEKSLEDYVAPLSLDISRKLAELTPREVRKSLEDAVENSVSRISSSGPGERESIVLTQEDFEGPTKVMKRPVMGFGSRTC